LTPIGAAGDWELVRGAGAALARSGSGGSRTWWGRASGAFDLRGHLRAYWWYSYPPPSRAPLQAKRGIWCRSSGWILLGLIAGFIASKIVNKSGEGFFLDIVGAIVGGFIFSAFGVSGVTGFNLYSMIGAIIGAIIVLVIYHAVFGRKATWAKEQRHPQVQGLQIPPADLHIRILGLLAPTQLPLGNVSKRVL
jgi:uncharacterized membrane protein YeaQ/YmgE (transglycosylase-associated protein family)